MSEEYINGSEKIEIKCPKGHIFKMMFYNFKQGQRCPLCKESIGERKIEKFLNNHDINYVREYRFDDCKNKRTLPFDFYLPDYNICIEFDGKQHFEYIEFFDKTKEKFELRKRNDEIKNEYCKHNNIKLIRISYLDKDKIEDILHKEL